MVLFADRFYDLMILSKINSNKSDLIRLERWFSRVTISIMIILK